jgi:hypothetical protein
MKHFYFPGKRSRQFGFERRSDVGQRACPDPLALFQATKRKAIGSGEKLLTAVSDDLKRGERTQLEA